jgi:dienelactone hydrolase
MRLRRRTLALFAVAVLAVALFRPARAHVRAASLLLRFSDPTGASHGLPAVGDAAVDESESTLTTPSGPARTRTYSPHGVANPPGLVLVHGIHRLGIDEPRLVRFARAIAASGVRVLTPEVKQLADYRVDRLSVDTLGAAAHMLANITPPTSPVGVMGMSFAGGLALLAAADPRFAPDIAFVVAVGAHDDLARVSRFFATDTIARPDGTTLAMHAHEYGPLVLVYSHVEDFFPAEDVAAAREALRAWLWEDHDEARAKLGALSEASRAKMQHLFDGHLDAIVPELLSEVDRSATLMAGVSPHGQLAAVHVPVYLLHGAGDSVIPPSETLWLARDLPADVVRRVLVSPALGHVELGASPAILDEWAVIDFLAAVLAQSEAERG